MPPDSLPFAWPAVATPPAPPTQVWPARTRPELIVDCWGVFLADPSGFIVGFDTNWGRGGQLARIAYAGRSSTRDL